MISTGEQEDCRSAPWHSHGVIERRRPGRLLWVDLLRGAALVGMVAYHAAWDLHAFGLSGVDPGTEPGWRLLGRSVAALFLALSGFSLSLAISQGHGGRVMLLRLLRIAGAAGLVSAATWLVSPEAPIWFGILHCIVVTNVVAIGLRAAPTAVLLAMAAAAWLAPHVLSGTAGAAWAWTGLAAIEPVTLDFRPVLPWLAPVLIGLSLGRTRLNRWSSSRWNSARAALPLGWAGRHSLGIYLLHQPPMLAVLMALSHGAEWRPAATHSLREPAQASAFLRQCRSDCTAAGGDDALCRSSCDCVFTRIMRLQDASSPRKDVAQDTIAAAVAACSRGDHEPDRPENMR